MTGAVTATRAALEVLDHLGAAHGPLVFFQSGGCCDGSSPMCLLASEMAPRAHDVKLGTVGEVPFYMDSDLYERWGRPGFLIDVSPGAGESFSLEGTRGVHFVTRAPAAA